MFLEHSASTADNLAQLPTRPLLLVCDIPRDIANFRKHLARDYRLHIAHTQAQALAYVERYKPAVALLDLSLGRGTTSSPEGFLTMEALLRSAPALKIIVITETTQRADAVHAVGAGAYDFYHKPIEGQILRIITNRAYRWEELEQENRDLALQAQQAPDSGIIGICPAMQHVQKKLISLATDEAPVLIYGAKGTGKKLVARAIHALGPRRQQHFVSIDCNADPERILVAELPLLANAPQPTKKFRKGKLAQAAGGTVLLEEIGRLTPTMQAHLLRYLKQRTDNNANNNIRIIAATGEDLAGNVQNQTFDGELFGLLGANSVELPPLRDRSDDCLLLARAFLHKYNAQYQQSRQGFATEALDAMLHYTWPQNVEELAQRVKRAVLMATSPMLTAKDLDLTTVASGKPQQTLREARHDAELHALRDALSVSAGNLSLAAKRLGVSRPTLYGLLKRYRLNTDGSAK